MKSKLVLAAITAFFLLVGAQSSFAAIRFGTSTVAVNNSNADYLRYVRYITVPVSDQNGTDWDAGNDTAGKTVEEIQIIVDKIKALETDARLQEIYTSMNASTEVFSFSDIAHAQATVLQRQKTIGMMEQFNLTQNYYYTTTIEPVSTSASQWQKGVTTPFYFHQTGGTAYQAIDEICAPATKTYGECLGAIITCVWWGASNALGETKFNQLYPGANALNMDSRQSSSPFSNLSQSMDDSKVVPGDWGYWKNYNYNEAVSQRMFYKKSWLEEDQTKKIYYWSGENALYFGSGLYEGLGVTGSNEDEMREALRTGYNDDLALVIAGLVPEGGIYNGLEIKTIDAGLDAERKLKFVYVKRPKH